WPERPRMPTREGRLTRAAARESAPPIEHCGTVIACLCWHWFQPLRLRGAAGRTRRRRNLQIESKMTSLRGFGGKELSIPEKKAKPGKLAVWSTGPLLASAASQTVDTRSGGDISSPGSAIQRAPPWETTPPDYFFPSPRVPGSGSRNR